MDRCDALVAAIFIVSSALVYYAIYWRCGGTLVDVERASANRSLTEWHLTRLASVLLVIGAVVRLRQVAREVTKNLHIHF